MLNYTKIAEKIFYALVRASVFNFALMKRKFENLQLWAAVAVVAVGCGLLVAGFVVNPPGQIHQSVLVGFGECLTFAGSLLGIDYRYRRNDNK